MGVGGVEDKLRAIESILLGGLGGDGIGDASGEADQVGSDKYDAMAFGVLEGERLGP